MIKTSSLDGKVCVVTGGAGLLGREFSRALYEKGARVIVLDMNEASARTVAESLGRDAIGIGADVTSKESLVLANDRVIKEWDRIDVIVNNAAVNEKVEDGAQLSGRFEEMSCEMFERSLKVNVTGVFLTSQVLGKTMSERGSGSIINIASTYGMVAPDQSLYRNENGTHFYKSAAYPTSKGAVISFTRYLAAYWGDRGIRVNSISPGGVENGQDAAFIRRYSEKTPLRRMALSEEIAAGVVFLASDDASYVTGTNLVMDGGWTAW